MHLKKTEREKELQGPVGPYNGRSNIHVTGVLEKESSGEKHSKK